MLILNLINQKSLISLTNLDECWKVTNEPQTALDRANLSNGNYGCVTGIVTKYSFKTQDGFVYTCNVEMISRQALYAGMRTENNTKVKLNSKSAYVNKSLLCFTLNETMPGGGTIDGT